MTTRPVTTRLRKDLLGEIEKVAKEESLDRSSTIQRLLERGLREYKVERALALYRDGKVTLWRAAEMVGVTLREMMDLIETRGIPYDYDIEGLEGEVRAFIERRAKR